MRCKTRNNPAKIRQFIMRLIWFIRNQITQIWPSPTKQKWYNKCGKEAWAMIQISRHQEEFPLISIQTITCTRAAHSSALAVCLSHSRLKTNRNYCRNPILELDQTYTWNFLKVYKIRTSILLKMYVHSKLLQCIYLIMKWSSRTKKMFYKKSKPLTMCARWAQLKWKPWENSWRWAKSFWAW